MVSGAEIDDRYVRHSGHLPTEMRKVGINIIGLGSVGSYVGYVLVAMGFTNVQGFDPDTVERHNDGNQIYPVSALGKPKSVAFSEKMWEDKKVRIQTFQARYTGQMLKRGIVIMAVDSMESRREIWGILKKDPAVELFMDVRMGLETILLYSFESGDSKRVSAYEETLKNDGIEAPCTSRVTLYTVGGAIWRCGSHIARFVRKDGEIPYLEMLDTLNGEIDRIKPKED